MTPTNSLPSNGLTLFGECSVDGTSYERGNQNEFSSHNTQDQLDALWEPPELENIEDEEEGGFAFDDDDFSYGSKGRKSKSLVESSDGRSKNRKANDENQKSMLKETESKFKFIVSQLIKSAGFSMEDVGDWLETVVRLSWEAASLLKPSINGRPIDPTEYIKVKCIATGSCNDSEVFKGLVFKKHASHKYMATKYEHPKIMLVEGVLGRSLSKFSSIKSLEKDKDYVRPVVDIIRTLEPNVILVEKSVSRDIQHSILCERVTLVADMKLHRLQRISRCIGLPVCSFDSLSSQKLKHCASFRIEKFFEEHNVVDKAEKMPTKTLMFLEGCRTGLGYTILLKGSQTDRLKKVKEVVEYSVVMAYHLILEASFLADRQTMFSTIFPKEATLCVAETEEFPLSLSPGESVIKAVDIPSSSGSYEQPMLLDLGVPVNKYSDDGDRSPMENDIETTLESQSILVLVSKRNALKEIMCDQSHFSHIEFYKQFDVPLERFLRDMFNQRHKCQNCEEYPEAHLYYYAHQNNQLTIQINHFPGNACLPGDREGKIWMWSRCKTKTGTQKSTKGVMISAAARSLSFGKFLELSFSQKTFPNRFSSCGNSFDRDFFGLGSMVAMLSYSQVTSYTVSMPSTKLEANILVKASWLENEFKEVFTKGISLFEDASRFLKKVRSQFTNTNLSHQCALESLSNIEELLKHERCGFEENIENSFKNAKTLDDASHKMLCTNRMRWELLLQALTWNYRLQSLVLSNRLISSSGKRKINEQEGDTSVPVTRDSLDDKASASRWLNILGWNEWFWMPFEQLQSKRIADVEKEYLLKFENFNNFTQENLPILNQIIAEEGSRLHISLKDDDFIVSDYEDELSSVIACALAQLSNDKNRLPLEGLLNKDQDSNQTVSHFSSEITNWLESLPPQEVLVTFGPLKAVGKPNYSVVCLYTDDFRDLRKLCFSSELDYIASLSRCKPSDGKRQSVFLKTLDDRLIVKEITKTEYESFVKFAPVYFRYMKASYDLGNHTCLAKVLGIHQVTIRQPKGGKDIQHYLMVMENLSFGRKITSQYDIKGCVNDRLTKTSANGTEVLLDQNFVNDMKKFPLYISETSKLNFLRAVYNDTSFLTSINVMDYSLVVGVDNESHELVCGITDYLKQYTWDKQLETWVKSCFFISEPTVINPIDYKTRFRKFMNTYFLHLADAWCATKETES